MTHFQKKVTKSGKERLIIEIPKELIHNFDVGDTVIVSKKEFPTSDKDLKKLSKILKGKFIELAIDNGISVESGYLKENKGGFLTLSDEDGNNKTSYNINNARIISLKAKNILKGYYINWKKVTKQQYNKALRKGQFGMAMEAKEDSIKMNNALKNLTIKNEEEHI